MLKDVAGKEIKVGQKVAVNPPYYKGLVLATVIKICPKKVCVEVYKQFRGYGSKEFYTFAIDVAILED